MQRNETEKKFFFRSSEIVVGKIVSGGTKYKNTANEDGDDDDEQEIQVNVFNVYGTPRSESKTIDTLFAFYFKHFFSCI